MNINVEILNKILQTKFNNKVIRSHAMIKWGLYQGLKDGLTSSNHSAWYITRIKYNNHMIISIDAKKAFDKIQHPSAKKLSTRWV